MSTSPTTLLVASSGGHFDELRLLADRIAGPPADRRWALPRTVHTEGLAPAEPVTWTSSIRSRQWLRAASGVPGALRLQRRLGVDRVVSTGAAQAVPHLLAATLRRREIVYVESATRLTGPSMTGRLARRLPRARLYTQSPVWADSRWQAIEDVFSDFTVMPTEPRPLTSAVVSLGSEQYGFERAVALVRAALPDVPITWQVGHTQSPERDLQRWLDPVALRNSLRSSSLAVVHAGVGSILAALESGQVPVVLPRASELGEHVDGHQQQLARSLAERGLVQVVWPRQRLGTEQIDAALRSRVMRQKPSAGT